MVEKTVVTVPDEEIEEWIKRMTSSVEDVGMMATDIEWEEYVSMKLFNERRLLPSQSQLDHFELMREGAQSHLGFRTEVYLPPVLPEYRFRDIATGRFISRTRAVETLLAWKVF